MYEGTIEPNLPDHVASTFEAVCREAVWEAVRTGQLGPDSDVGRLWYSEQEIDIVGLSPAEGRILLAECKWTDEPVGHGLVDSLREKSNDVRWGPPDRDEEFALFSKSGFVDGLAEDIGDEWSLFGLPELRELLWADRTP